MGENLRKKFNFFCNLHNNHRDLLYFILPNKHNIKIMKEQNIFINQIGYPTESAKFGYVRSHKEEDFYIKNTENQIVYTGKLSAPKNDRVAGEDICTIDFSDFTQEGNFYICVGEDSSFPFQIGKNLFNNLFYKTLRYFYLSRCGQKIEDADFGHEPCHTGKALIYGTDQEIEVQGGWHDAGDYGRYIIAGTKTCMDLLLAYEQTKDSFHDFDILAEVRFELEWMLQMQRDDGALYHKISCFKFCGFIEPQEEKEQIVLAPISTTATADFAGCAAYAHAFYKKSDPAFAQKLLDAAIKAQNFIDTNPDFIYTNPPEITTGGYGDINILDEKYFALCSLYATTKNVEYLKKAIQIFQNYQETPRGQTEPVKTKMHQGFGWGSVAAYGTEILLKNKELKELIDHVDPDFYQSIKNAILEHAEKLTEISKNASFGTCFTGVMWGSNGHISDEAHLLLLAHDISGKKEYFDVAKKQFDYVLGCNPVNFCYVTGFGTQSPKYPHHRPSGALKKVMPGMLAGGAAEGLMDVHAKKHLQGKPPLKCYLDISGSYSTNEVAIYWNSPFVYITAKLGLV